MTPFTAQAKANGWKMKDIAKRWGILPRQLSRVAANPSQRDWDSLAGLPNLITKLPKSVDTGQNPAKKDG